jgi:hypothetical protein
MFRKLSVAALTLITLVSISDAKSAQAANLINGDFETSGGTPYVAPNTYVQTDASNVAGWSTTDGQNKIEIWGTGFNGVTAASGSQFAELNATTASTLFQNVSGIAAGQQIGFQFFHRARVGTDVMSLTITDLGADGIFGTSDDTTLFTKNYSATTAAWEQDTNAGESPIITLGNTLRFAYSAVSTGSGDASVGNFLDGVSFGVGVGAKTVPEPASILGLLAFGALGATSLKRKQKETAGSSTFRG